MSSGKVSFHIVIKTVGIDLLRGAKTTISFQKAPPLLLFYYHKYMNPAIILIKHKYYLNFIKKIF